MGVALKDLNKLCYAKEEDYSTDESVKSILINGTTPYKLLEACQIIKYKEKSNLIKLPLDLNLQARAFYSEEEECTNVEDLTYITDIACSSGSLKLVLDCIELAGRQDIMLRVQGPFSCLLTLVGSNQLLKWILKYPTQIKNALEKIMEGSVNYVIEALKRRVKIISLADPAAVNELLGEKRYKEFVGIYIIKFLRLIEKHLDKAVVHICPRTSILLEKYGFLEHKIVYEDKATYSESMLVLANENKVKFLGHRCIHCEKSRSGKIYVLKLL